MATDFKAAADAVLNRVVTSEPCVPGVVAMVTDPRSLTRNARPGSGGLQRWRLLICAPWPGGIGPEHREHLPKWIGVPGVGLHNPRKDEVFADAVRKGLDLICNEHQ